MTDSELCDEQIVRCKRLAVHVLQELILDLAGRGLTEQRGERDEKEREENRKEARRFIKTSSPEPFGFAWICETLDIDEQYFRNELLINGTDKWVRQWEAKTSGRGLQGETWITDLKHG